MLPDPVLTPFAVRPYDNACDQRFGRPQRAKASEEPRRIVNVAYEQPESWHPNPPHRFIERSRRQNHFSKKFPHLVSRQFALLRLRFF